MGKRDKSFECSQKWSDAFGDFISVISKVYKWLRGAWTRMDIDPHILHWIDLDSEGAYHAQVALEKLGKEYQAAMKRNENRFKVLESKEADKNDILSGDFVPNLGHRIVTAVQVDQNIPPKVYRDGRGFIKVTKHEASGKAIIQRIGDMIYVNGRELVLFSVKSGYNQKVGEVLTESIQDDDAVSASVLDALLEYRHSLIPEKWEVKYPGESTSILFTKTEYGDGFNRGVRNLSHRHTEVWRDYVVSFDHRWSDRFLIAKLLPMGVSSEDTV